MTFCVGMRLKEGIIGLADNLIITGNEAIRAKKVLNGKPQSAP